LITEVEKYLGRCVRQGQSLVQNVPDPFDKKELELKRRDQTKAGEVDILAKEQTRLADDLATTNALAGTPADAGKPDPERIMGSPAERESRIHQRLGVALEATNFAAEIATHLEQGRRQAQAALSSLQMDDAVAAREPAAESARELRLAAGAMKRAAEQAAKNELADALRALSDAAGGARSTPAQISDAAARQQATNVMHQVREAARRLAEAAWQQQEMGSATAAAQLNELAQSLAAADLQKALQQLREQPRDPEVARRAANKLQDLADRAGMLRNNGPLSPTELARLADRLKRAHANIQRLTAQNAASKSPGQTGAGGRTPGTFTTETPPTFGADIISDVREDLFAAMPALPQAAELAGLRRQFRESPAPGASSAEAILFLKSIDPPLEGIIKLLCAVIPGSRRPYQLTEDEMAQAPAGYRPAVADYFERLSRDYPANSKVSGK
jgi:hypothetical protein